jgi:hypothetical protein
MDAVAPTPVPRLRWRIGSLIGAGVLINYFDRISLSVAGPQLQLAFALTPADMGLLLSAFFWSYALLQIPAGLLLTADRATLSERLRSREHHFMPEALLDSQLSTFELPAPDENVMFISAGQSVQDMLRTVTGAP